MSFTKDFSHFLAMLNKWLVDGGLLYGFSIGLLKGYFNGF